MYEDLISGSLGSPGLLDHFFLLTSEPSWWYSVLITLRYFLISMIEMLQSLSLWIRTTPLVLAVVSLFFIGFLCSIFFRVYHSL